jgi:hypothetical protein
MRSDVREDGFGSRYTTEDIQFGPVEILEVSSALGAPVAEQAIRACAARHGDGNAPMLARVVRIARKDQVLSITSIATPGASVGDLLGALEFGTITLSDAAILEAAGGIIGALAAMHRLAGARAHGALSPGHVILRGDRSVMLTGAVFGDALQGLQCNREQLWRLFGVALPPSASLPRFDQRADVTQLGALVLALVLRRTLAPGEYPKGMVDLVEAATETMDISARCRSALRMWLQQTLQLHPKALFATASDAARAYADVVADLPRRGGATRHLQAAIRHLGGEPADEDLAASRPEPVQAPRAVVSPVRPAAPVPQLAGRRIPFLRNVFPAFGAN